MERHATSGNLRSLPSVDQVLQRLAHLDWMPRGLVTTAVRRELATARAAILANSFAGPAPAPDTVAAGAERRLNELLSPSLRRVINATGVILHTNLGRAPLVDCTPLRGYSNLEYSLALGRRGKRDAHTGPLLEWLLGAPAILVNNNAAAVYLVLHELARGFEVIVSRGELVEIGDGFRIPEIMARSGATLVEVGATNRTHIEDYAQALNSRTRCILRVHPSNFRLTGFAGRPDLAALCRLGRDRGVPVFEDLGSGCLVDLRPYGIDEPRVQDSLEAGAGLVSFSGDKLLGGPQCGIIAGDPALVNRVRRNPMYRAFRVDKLAIQMLGTTLRELLVANWSAIPALRMIAVSASEVRERAERLVEQLMPLACRIRPGQAAVGGGSTPDQSLPTWLVELEAPSASLMERTLRSGPVPVLARIEHDRVMFDLRTVAPEEEADLVAAIQWAALNPA